MLRCAMRAMPARALRKPEGALAHCFFISLPDAATMRRDFRHAAAERSMPRERHYFFIIFADTLRRMPPIIATATIFS
jgi:hypothetical protein